MILKIHHHYNLEQLAKCVLETLYALLLSHWYFSYLIQVIITQQWQQRKRTFIKHLEQKCMHVDVQLKLTINIYDRIINFNHGHNALGENWQGTVIQISAKNVTFSFSHKKQIKG